MCCWKLCGKTHMYLLCFLSCVSLLGCLLSSAKIRQNWMALVWLKHWGRSIHFRLFRLNTMTTLHDLCSDAQRYWCANIWSNEERKEGKKEGMKKERKEESKEERKESWPPHAKTGEELWRPCANTKNTLTPTGAGRTQGRKEERKEASMERRM